MRHFIWGKRPLAVRAVVLGIAVVAALFASGGVSQASSGTHAVYLGSAPLIRLHCDHPTAHTLQIMQQFQQTIQHYHLCTSTSGSQAPQTMPVSPNNTVEGDCGTASLWLFWTGTPGQTWFSEQLVSTDGTILEISYTVDWVNNNAQTNGIISNSYWGNGSNVWSNNDYRNTGAGKTSGVMSGTIIALEDLCEIGYPSDFDIHP